NSPSSSEIDLRWTDRSINEDGFTIERRTGSSEVWVQLGGVGSNVTTYVDSADLTASTSYSYRVRAYNDIGTSGYTNDAEAITSGIPAPAGGLTAAPASSTSIDLTWVDTAINETGFRVEQSQDGLVFTEVANVGPDATSYSVARLDGGTVYWF